MVGLKNVGKRTVGEFSKGMARRVGLAQALVNDPDLIILDEPTSGLDPVACKEVKNLIKTLAERGKTVILSSHLLADVEDVVDRVVVLYGGQIRAQGTTDELLLVEDKTTITTPKMSKEVLEKVLKILDEEYSQEDLEVTHPRLDLESFFLDVVDRARSESVHTAGAESGEVAEYLRTSSDSQVKEMAAKINETESEEEKAKLQEQIEVKEASAKLASIVQESEEKAPVQPEITEEEQVDQHDSAKLDSLVEIEDKPVEKDTNIDKKSETEDLSKANDKLKKLLGDD